MLRSLISNLRCPTCKPKQAPLTLHDFGGQAAARGPHVEDGLLVCEVCHTWYTIEDGLTELTPPALQDAEARAAFIARFTPDLVARSLRIPPAPVVSAADSAGVADQVKQRQHFDWYAENTSQSYQEYQNTPFWRASDDQTIRRWRPLVPEASLILDVGCADGRGGFYFVHLPGVTLVGFDISRKMVANAIVRARREGFYDRATFLVADATSLPFAPDTFDVVITFGVLHHLPDPGQASRDLQVVLKRGGVHLGLENNLTVVRPIFDFMMKVLPLWSEEAGTEPLISETMLRDWLRNVPVRISCATSVFVPPHVLNWLGHGSAGTVLRTSDAIACGLPGVRGLGGLIVFELVKTADAATAG